MTGDHPMPLRFTGDYSLAASVTLAARAAFAPAMRTDHEGAPRLDIAFPMEGSWHSVAASITQTEDGVSAAITANPGGLASDIIRARLEHILALDVPGEGYRQLALTDPVIAGLQAERPGVRPVLFPSPYESAARAIIGHRLHVRQAAAVHARIAADHGTTFDIGGRPVYAFPAPDGLAVLPSVVGLADRKVVQLRALGVAAGDGWLDTQRLAAMAHNAAMAHLQKLGGIGPFSAELILLRGVGDPDAFPLTEMRLQGAMAAAYTLGEDPDLQTLEAIADTWRPYRSWVGLLLRHLGR